MASETPGVSKESFRAELDRLVANFAANEAELTSPGYTEMQARTQFITPFFRALGWDVENRAAKPYREMEVLEETGPGEGRPDYTFRIGAIPKFFVEAKAPHEHLDSQRHVLQVKSYAWSTKEVFAAILTDFEEFRFYDASQEPDLNHPHRGLLYDFRYTQYLDNFDKLWEFSRARVAEGSIEALLPRDKLSLRFRKPPDDKFLEDMTRWRAELAQAVHKRNPGLDAAQLTDIVQRLLDRLIFLRVAEDRRILEKNTLLDRALEWEAIGGRKPLLPMLNELFHVINNDFNGEIFKPHPSEQITLDNDPTLHRIIKELYPPRGPYRFDAIPVDIFGAVYERYLGKTIYVRGKQVRVEDKPEVRKAGGVYYTPKYIVDYIVKHTVGKLIEGKSPREIENIKILDPACGSGSFLLGAYQYLIDYHVAWYEKHPKEAHAHPLYPELITTRAEPPGTRLGENRLSLNRKAKILSHNLFGVDLDPQAVEITMMNLYLKALEGEREIPHNKRVLPELSANIKCGNSLIAPDIAEQQKLSPEEWQRLKPFDWHAQFPDIMKRGGFHAVLGNPPWGQKAVKFSPAEKGYLIKNFSTATGILDLFKLFVERAITLVRPDGLWGMILPDIILLKNYPETRKLVLQRTEIDWVAHAGMAFEGVDIDSAVLICRRKESPPDTLHNVRVVRNLSKNKDDRPDGSLPQSLFWTLPGYKLNIHLDKEKLALTEKLNALPKFDSQFDVHEGIHSGNVRKKLFLEKRLNSYSKKLIFGRGEVARFFLRWGGKWVNYNPAIVKRERGEYANLGKPEYFKNPKMFVRRTGDFVLTVVDTRGFYASNNLFVMLPKDKLTEDDLYFYAAVLNSNLITWYYQTIQPRVGKAFAELKINQINSFPLPPQLRDARAGMLRQNLARVSRELHRVASEPTSSEKTTKLVRQLNDLVYDLYGLTPDEIALVEKAVARKE